MSDSADTRPDPADGGHPGYRTEPVSFTRRGGRLNDRQQKSWDLLADTMVVDVPRSGPSTSVDPQYVLDTDALFGRSARLVVEIGSGRGEVLVHAATEAPDTDFLGLEVYKPGVAQTLIGVRHGGLTNVRLAIVNAAEALTTTLPEASVDELWVHFPDPWHKKRHQKRRLVTPAFAHLAARVLKPGGTWRLATDWAEYAEQMAEVVAGSPDFEGGRSERWDGRVLTRFEAKGIAAGREIHDLTAVRR
ncbi:tRNA (guanosine(46)-N7)-methyltransferase TrmB [Aeromicrobium sp. Leaf350]|uniref:tRNA (guanosine(46)-N7)-methyltransferase TrmB n=1 Tax=Aeromicrobium sp. Leaf350 TaxID=2876565 RepID=UPI001E5DB3F6|nr:tRNA (guanosine(46)-N7)-methyltransferase TrmB [Aeromicrobium sp. Leaf350]